MSCGPNVFSATARFLRKVSKPTRFNRLRASRDLQKRTLAYWRGGLDALFAYLDETEGFASIQRHCLLHRVSAGVRKALSDADRRMLTDLLANFGYYDDVEQQAAAIVEATRFDTYEAAARFALGRLGIKAADFRLRNESIRETILARRSADVHAARNNVDGIMRTIVDNFYELGNSPYDPQFIASLRKQLGDVTAYEAHRFALTETGIASEMAQADTYRRNGVTRKRWNILGVNTRQSHQELDQVDVGIDETFDVGGYAADHPLDPALPAGELVNCHCWLTPVVDDEYQLDPSKIWEGE